MKCNDIICDKCGSRIEDYPNNTNKYNTYEIRITNDTYYTHIGEGELCSQCDKEVGAEMCDMLNKYFTYKKLQQN